MTEPQMMCFHHFYGRNKKCSECLPDYEAWSRPDFVPNSCCNDYYPIPVRTIIVQSEDGGIPKEYRKEIVV